MREKLSALESVDLVPTRRISDLSQLSFKKFKVNQDFISDKQLIGVERGSGQLGLLERESWVSSAKQWKWILNLQKILPSEGR